MSRFTANDGTQRKLHHFRFHAPHAHLASLFGDDAIAVKAERFARFFGTPLYLVVQSAVVAVWVALNILGMTSFDPYPFILLNLAFSLQAAYAAPLILLAQTRQADRDKAHADADAQHREALGRIERQDLVAKQGGAARRASGAEHDAHPDEAGDEPAHQGDHRRSRRATRDRRNGSRRRSRGVRRLEEMHAALSIQSGAAITRQTSMASSPHLVSLASSASRATAVIFGCGVPARVIAGPEPPAGGDRRRLREGMPAR
jgi:uncharacterized membrane protein